MGHNPEHRTYPEKVSRSKVKEELDNYVAMADWEEGCRGLYHDIRWYDEPLMENEQAAYEFLKRHDGGDYDNLAVRFKEPIGPIKSKKLETLKEKARTAEEKYNNLRRNSYLKGLSISYIGCKKCGSKLNVKELCRRAYGSGNTCPVCGADLRPPSVVEKEEKARQAWEKAQQEIRAETEREAKKKKQKIMWLVKFEYHT